MISQGCVKPGAERVSFRVLDATTSMPEGPFDAVLLIDTWEFLADPAKTLWHVRGVLRAGALGFIVTPHPAWRVPISLAEALRIKRLRPPFGYRNGARRVIEVAALAGGLTVREMTWVYGTLARVAILEWRRTRRRRRAGTQKRVCDFLRSCAALSFGRAAGGRADAVSPRAAALIRGPLLGPVRCSVRRDGAPPEVRHAAVGEGGYGDLVPSRDCPELALPPGFRVVRLSVSGERMSDGVATPGFFDGMAAFSLPNGHVRLVRNHEIFTRRSAPQKSGSGAAPQHQHGDQVSLIGSRPGIARRGSAPALHAGHTTACRVRKGPRGFAVSGTRGRAPQE